MEHAGTNSLVAVTAPELTERVIPGQTQADGPSAGLGAILRWSNDPGNA